MTDEATPAAEESAPAAEASGEVAAQQPAEQAAQPAESIVKAETKSLADTADATKAAEAPAEDAPDPKWYLAENAPGEGDPPNGSSPTSTRRHWIRPKPTTISRVASALS